MFFYVFGEHYRVFIRFKWMESFSLFIICVFLSNDIEKHGVCVVYISFAKAIMWQAAHTQTENKQMKWNELKLENDCGKRK